MVSYQLVRRRRRQYEAAAAAYRAAILAALEEGASYADVARALGVSRQSIRQLAQRAGSGSERSEPCEHPPARYYAWTAYDGVQCVACCDCGAVLAGGL